MPRGHEHNSIYSLSIRMRGFCGQLIFLKVFPEKDCNGKEKIVVPCLDVIMNAFSPTNIQ